MTTSFPTDGSPMRDEVAPSEVAYRLRQQQLLSDFGLFALQCRDLDQLMQRACELAAAGLNTRFAKVLKYRPELDDLLVCAGVGWERGVVGHATVGADLASPAGYALKTGEAVISNHLSDEQRFRTPRLLAEHGIRRAINVLIPGGDSFRGVLEVDSTDAGQFGEADLAFLQGFAHLIAVAAERQKAEAASAEGEARYRSLVENAPEKMWVNRADGSVAYFNAAWRAYTGQPARPEGLAWADAVHPEDRARMAGIRAQAITAGERYDVELRLRRASDGAYRWHTGSVAPLKDAAGRITEWVGIASDVDDVRGIDEALREETRTLETLNRVGAALASELDLERVVQMVTDAGVELTGARFGAYFHNIMDETGERLSLYTLSGAERSAFEKFGKPRPTAIFGPTFRNEGVIRSDDILVDPRYGKNAPHKGMPEGHLPVRSYMAVPVVARSGEVLGGLLFGHPEPGRFTERHEKMMVGIAAQAAIAIDNARLYQNAQREIEERRQTEERLRVSEERLRLATEAADVGTWDYDPATGDLRWDNRCKELFGLPASTDVDYDTFLAGVHPEDRAAVDAAVKRALTPGGPDDYGIECRTVGIEDGVERWIAAKGRAFFEGGRATRFVGTIIDISDRKHLETLLRERVAQQDMLMREVSHRVKNSLAMVSGLLGLQARASKDPGVRRAIEDAGTRVGTVAQVHDQLWRQTPGENIDLDSFLRDLCAMVAETAPAHEIVYMGEPVSVSADRAVPLGLLVNELVTNAVKYAYPDDTGGEVRVELRAPAGDGIRLEVADRGVGLPAGFDLAKPNGSLGLRIINGMGRQLGATIRTESAEPGARFVIDLPRRS